MNRKEMIKKILSEPQLTGKEVDIWREKVHRLQQMQAEYSNNHRVCPKCRTNKYTTTLVVFHMKIGEEETFQDCNDIMCQCGWSGIKHDLVRE